MKKRIPKQTVIKIVVDLILTVLPVSYTHLDVYKRQGLGIAKAVLAQNDNAVVMARNTRCV